MPTIEVDMMIKAVMTQSQEVAKSMTLVLFDW
jgi:hypothetical protein